MWLSLTFGFVLSLKLGAYDVLPHSSIVLQCRVQDNSHMIDLIAYGQFYASKYLDADV